MDCIRPITIILPGGQSGEVTVPCGRCIACRLNRSSSWAVRIMHELKMHNGVGCFITLTYNEDNIPLVNDFCGTLVKEDVQKFMKRLRKAIAPTKVRYYLCGEYGETKSRPHYHICLFGWRPDDLVLYKRKSSGNLYLSDFLENIWKFGFVTVGDISYDSANYVAKYCTKVLTGKEKIYYVKHNIIPEFSLMSRRPGLGASWIDKYEDEVREHHNVIMKGRELPVPRYYKDRVYAQLDRAIDRYNSIDYIIEKEKAKLRDIYTGMQFERQRQRERDIMQKLRKRGE